MSRYPNKCNYLQKVGGICNQNCEKERCSKHLKAKTLNKCQGIDCVKLSSSKYGYCSPCGAHAREETRKLKNRSLRAEKQLIVMEEIKTKKEIEREERLTKLMAEKNLLTEKLDEINNQIIHEMGRIKLAMARKSNVPYAESPNNSPRPEDQT